MAACWRPRRRTPVLRCELGRPSAQLALVGRPDLEAGGRGLGHDGTGATDGADVASWACVRTGVVDRA